MANLPSLGGNWVDLVIVLVLLYYASYAFRYGLWYILGDFASFLLAILVSLRLYKFVAALLKQNFNLTDSLGNALGFILASILLEVIFNYLFAYLISLIPKKIRESKISDLIGLIPAVGEGLILVAFFLTAVVALPVRPDIKKAVSESRIGSYIVEKTSGIEKGINEVFGGAINDALTYLTIEPKSNETIALKNGIDKLSVDESSEVIMLSLVNKERTSRGLSSLRLDYNMRQVARDYAKDMWERHYFSHYNPEGKTVADRFDAAGIEYTIVGENLALAPTVQTAHTGLMNSAGHRANILETRFKRIGIGIIDNGIYGKMFVQEFAD